jgi:uncharacterized protein YecE (DUF72 family)
MRTTYWIFLQDTNMALCISDHRDAPSPWIATATHVYVRGHAPAGDYRDHYSSQKLARWTQIIKGWRSQRRVIYVYFDNDQRSAAPPAGGVELIARETTRRRKAPGFFVS